MRVLLFFACLQFALNVSGQVSKHTSYQSNNIQFVKNNGQWNKNALYRTPLGHGAVFLEANKFTYVQVNPGDLDIAHSHSGEHHGHEHGHKDPNNIVNGHAWRANFIDANPSPTISGFDERTAYHNYYLGNDKSKWATRVPIYNGVTYEELYTGIDMKVYSAQGNFKYDFIVAPRANASKIKMKYTGLDNITVENGNLVSKTSIGNFAESKPFAYQIIDHIEHIIECEYVLKDGEVQFYFPKGYNKAHVLVIDPELEGATLSGSTVANYGHCATYDNEGKIYTGARSFGVGYPVEDGAFQTDFGGSVDIAISVYTPDATDLVYASYLGGTQQDLIHSMIVNEENEIYVFGTTKSVDYPVSDDAFDASGPEASSIDIVITHFNSDATDIIGSTFVGGSNVDGINDLTSNYGDDFRGEIIVDPDGNCYIASCTRSNDFPVTPGAYQETYGGGMQDAVVFKMPPNLSSLTWSTFIGGTSGEGGFGLRIDSEDNIYVCGTASDDFMEMTGYIDAYQGGLRDAFVVKLIDDGTSIEYSTFWGTSATDAGFFLDLDHEDNVYLYGTSSDGTSEVTDGVYFNPGSHQYICKLDPSLENLQFGTVVGAGGENFVPSAFMVDPCGYVYYSGHQASDDLPLTDDALFETGGFYLAILQPEAIDLEFATYYSGDHVDGGTSRYDKLNSTIYQAVCACDPFTTTPDAYSTSIGAVCDIGVFKINFGIVPIASIANPLPSNKGCTPFTVIFENESIGETFEWNFDDDGTTSTEFEPTYTYEEPGVYNVRLVAFNPDGCVSSDTSFIEITVLDSLVLSAEITPAIDGDNGSIDLSVEGGLPPYYFDWDTDETDDFDDEEDLADLPIGIYSVVVRDSLGCESNKTFNLSNVSILQDEQEFILAPNPTDGYLNITFDGEFDYVLYSMTGQIIVSGQGQDHKILDLTTYARGVYLLNLYSADIAGTFKIAKD